MKQIRHIFEFLWLLTFIGCLAAAIHQTLRQGIQRSYMFFLMGAMAFAMYWLRRTNRMSNEQDE